MKVKSTRHDEVMQLTVEGETLDGHSSALVKAQALGAIDGRADVIIDLSQVDFIDSMGLGVLVSLYKCTRSLGRRTKFIGVRPRVLRIMKIIKLDEIFDLYPSLEAAVAALGEAAACRASRPDRGSGDA